MGPASTRPVLDRARLEAIVARFERDCSGGTPWPDPLDYLPPADDPDRPAILVELVHADLELRRRAGRETDLAADLGRFAELDPMARGEVAASAAASATAPPGLPRPFGRFVLESALGQGAWGVVYRAEDTLLGRPVALKLARIGGEVDEAGAERFLREARHAAHLRHPGIVPVYEAGRVEGRCYLVRELVDGPTLAGWRDGRRIDARVAADRVAEIADALAYAHAQGVIHRDVTPSNVLMAEGDRPRLTDFGLARSDHAGSLGPSDGALLGTPAYMAPEQARGDRVDARSDVYALGVILYELLAGEPPFRGSPAGILAQVMEDEPTPPRRLDDRIPRDLETVLLKAMAKEPHRRYPTAEAFRDDLRRWLDGRPVVARPAGTLERTWRRARRRPWAAALLLLVAASLTAGGAATAWEFDRADRQRRADEAHRVRMREGLNLVNRVLLSATEDLRDPAGGSSRTMAGLDALRARLGDDPALRGELARAYARAGGLFYQAGRRADGAAPMRRADLLFAELVREYPLSPGLVEERARIGERLLFATVPPEAKQERLRGYEEALGLWRSTRSLWLARARREPDNAAIPRHVAMTDQKIALYRERIVATRAEVAAGRR